ncbi:MAG TPA: ImmA/IrrE family metallo-endopeptidase [Gaiellaceae bacterium]|nr:ImmA/IrrE family metallo-endopeptidase [Gaiellaceae bacterium]
MRALAGPVSDERAHALRRRYLEAFGGAEFPVPVEAIAEDLLGLAVERAELPCSGMLLPAERRIVVNAAEVPTRQRFTVAHELGHWVCQVLEGDPAPVYCRAEDVGVDPAAKAREREANVFAAELLMPEEAVRAAAAREPDPAAAFGVSGEAMGWRLYNLGLGDVPIARSPS